MNIIYSDKTSTITDVDEALLSSTFSAGFIQKYWRGYMTPASSDSCESCGCFLIKHMTFDWGWVFLAILSFWSWTEV